MIAEDAAVQLIRWHSTGYPRDRDSVERILAECTDPEQLGDLLHAVLELFATIAARLRTDLPLLYAAITEIAEYDQDLDRRPGAELILAYRWFAADTFDDNLFRDRGAGDLELLVGQVNEAGRTHETILAVVDVWNMLLPELDSQEGMKLLNQHGMELGDSS
jgi:hypothetical protein